MQRAAGVQQRRKAPATTEARLYLLLFSLLWLPAAAQAPGGTQGGPPAPAGCTANSYSSLEGLISSGGCGSPHVTIALDCTSQKSLARRALPPLQGQPAPGSHWSLSSDCFHTILVNLTENPAMPVLSLKATPGSGSKLFLGKIRFLVAGGADLDGGRPPCSPDAGPCTGVGAGLPAIIDVAGFDEVEARDLIVSPLDESQLPFVGMRVTGAASVRLDSIFTRSCVDGIQVLLGGDLEANNVRAIGHSNTGLAYTCLPLPDARPDTGIRLRGSRSGFTQNKASGVHVACSSIYKAGPLQVAVQQTVLFGSNGGPGMTLVGEVQALFWPGVTFSNNGAAAKAGSASLVRCGGGLYAQLVGTRSTIVFTGVKFYNNAAATGGGVCVWLSQDATAAGDAAPMAKAAASVTLQSNTVFNGNAAKDGCGGALTTIADMATAQLDVSVKDSKAWNRNTAAAAPTWCILQSRETTSYMAIDLA